VASADVVGLAVGGAGGDGTGETTGVDAVVAGGDFATLGDGVCVTTEIGGETDEQAAATNRPKMTVTAKRECFKARR
jgi:hypothetical protein